MNAFFSASYRNLDCLLVRNFHNRYLNNLIKMLQERVLCLVYKYTNSSIVELLEKENTYFHNSSEKHLNMCY